MRIMGIDPGYAILGWSIIEDSLRIIEYGVITTDKALPLEDRILVIHNNLNSIIARYKPETAAIEKLFFQKNTKTALEVTKVIGAVLLTLKLSGIQLGEYTPTQVKMSITGYGRASKEQMQTMMMRLLNMKEIPTPDDAADALAIAVCHSCKCRIKSI
jgi:crossover junction endodeoxyribonuclease RuvC